MEYGKQLLAESELVNSRIKYLQQCQEELGWFGPGAIEAESIQKEIENLEAELSDIHECYATQVLGG